MKTKELIEELKEVDPEGELDVVLKNGDAVIAVDATYGFWDGPYGVYKDNKSYTLKNTGQKLILYSINEEDMVFDNAEYYEQLYKHWREYIHFDFSESYREEELIESHSKRLDKIEQQGIEIAKEIAEKTKSKIINEFNNGNKIYKTTNGDYIWANDGRSLTVGEKQVVMFDKDFYLDEHGFVNFDVYNDEE